MDLCVLGLGYVGCVTAASLARNGHRVTGVDVNGMKVDAINAGRAPLVEPGLEALVASVVGEGRLRATTDASEAVAASDAALICVGTPGLPHGRPDADAIERAGREIGQAVAGRKRPFTVVLRSTVLPGTTERVLLPALRAGAGTHGGQIDVMVNPEFMREGSALRDFDQPPFIVVGRDERADSGVVRDIYKGVDAHMVETTIRSAEFVKYASNTYHALKVCFANELARVCDAVGADPHEVSRVFLLDRKLNVSEAYLRPGFAFGGSCLPKDLRALLWAAHEAHVSTPLLASILPSNTEQIREAIDAVLATRARRVGVVGLAFKAGTDDLRESPVVTLVEALIGKGCDLRILDRNVTIARLTGANRRYIDGEIPHIAALLCADADELARHADVLVVGSATDQADAVLAAISPSCAIIDLTRGAVTIPESRAPQLVRTCA